MPDRSTRSLRLAAAAVLPAVQRLALLTQRGRLRPAWAAAHWLAARVYGRYLVRGVPGASVYVSGSLAQGDPIYGLADIDPKVVLASDTHGRGAARARIRRRGEFMGRRLRDIGGSLLDTPIVFEQRELEEVAGASIFGYGLEPQPGQPEPDAAVYFGPRADPDRAGLFQRPGLYGPGADWRLIVGPDRRPARAQDAQERRVAAWLELQSYWRWFLQECPTPNTVRMADLCVKLVAEPLRILLWLTHGERPSGRTQVLERATELLPAERPAIAAALELQEDLGRLRAAPGGQFLAAALRLSELVAQRLVEEVAPEGIRRVRLVWGDAEELLLAPGLRRWLRHLGDPDAESSLLPLVDWRALARSDAPDEALVPIQLEPTDLPRLGTAAEVGNMGAYPAARVGGLLVLASQRWPRSALRGVQCAVTDPISFGLLAGKRDAEFPEARGWSAGDWARRAVAEHGARLEADLDVALEPGQALATLLPAARAALFLESLEAGEPELSLTVTAVVERLAERGARSQAIAHEAGDAYKDFVLAGVSPPKHAVSALREAVLGLPAYASSAGDRAR